MEEQSATRGVLVAVVEGRRQRGRPKLRWEDGVMEDARKLGGEKLEECCKEQGQLAEASEEGHGSKGAVVPKMMMMYSKYVFKLKAKDCGCLFFKSFIIVTCISINN